MPRIIQISELSFATRDRRRVLENVYFSVERGEVVGIVGPTGSGKTLLMGLLQGEIKPLQGQILVNDRNVTRLSHHKLLQLRQHLGVLPQSPVWPQQLNVEDALKFKLSWLGLSLKQAGQKIQAVFSLLGLDSLREQKFVTLNLLEQRTAYLALSLCHDPILLLCDDPFSGLDQAGETTLAIVLQKIHERRKLTTVVTSQRLESLERLNCRLAVLQGGGLQEAPSL